MTEFEPEQVRAGYQASLANVGDEELIQALNREVGNPGWVSARGIYLKLLRTELSTRHFDLSAVGGLEAFPGKRKFTLIGKKLVFADDGSSEDATVAEPSDDSPWSDI